MKREEATGSMSFTVDQKGSRNPGRRGAVARLLAGRDGVAAIEFAILAIPFFLIVFAIIETFVAFAGEQLLENAVDTMARELRTGQITYNRNPATDKDEAAFRKAFCDEISIMLSCAGTNDAKLYLDVRKFNTFADMPIGIPRQGGTSFGALDTSSFDYDPGGPGSFNMVRAYYRWQIVTDLVRPYITNERPGGGATSDYLMVATTAFANEDYP